MVHFFISSMTINILQILGKALMIFLSVHGTSIMTLIIFILGKLRLCLYMNLVATTKRRLGNKAMLKNDFFSLFLFKLNYQTELKKHPCFFIGGHQLFASKRGQQLINLFVSKFLGKVSLNQRLPSLIRFLQFLMLFVEIQWLIKG